MDRSHAILERFLALHPRKIDLSLGRLERLLQALGHPHLRLPPTLHVAGTNGKGSTIAFARAILEAAGKKVHVYTSPHLVRFHERIRLAGQLVEEQALVYALRLCEEANQGAPITVFEMITAAAFVLFSQHAADVLLLEVGLGGRFDATNVINAPVATMITPVSFDHMEFLGTELKQIAHEKAGILKSGVPAFIGPQQTDAREDIEAVAALCGAPLHLYGQEFYAYSEHGRLVFSDQQGLLDLPLPALKGRHQIENAALAIAALRHCFNDLAPEAFAQGMKEVTWPARLQRLKKGPLVDVVPDGAEVWLDGGHNQSGGQALALSLTDLNPHNQRPVVMICASLTTKDSKSFLQPFHGKIDHLIAIPLTAPSAASSSGEHAGHSPAFIAQWAGECGIDASSAASLQEALCHPMIQKASPPPLILIAGSLYLAGTVLHLNEQWPN